MFVLCFDGAVVSVATMIGQAVVPVPVVGALLGAVVGRFAVGVLRKHVWDTDAALIWRLEARYDDLRSRLDEELRAEVARFEARFAQVDRMIERAFDPGVNASARLAASADLAVACGVDPDVVLRTVDEVDAFVLGDVQRGSHAAE